MEKATSLSLSVPFLLFIFFISCNSAVVEDPIDRYALVNRHRIEIHEADTLGSLSVGNGNFEFTTDITGLQTFYREYGNGVALGTMSNWGWHSFPDTAEYDIRNLPLFRGERQRCSLFDATKGSTRISCGQLFQGKSAQVASGDHQVADHEKQRGGDADHRPSASGTGP
jgi:hypothetical protein